MIKKSLIILAALIFLVGLGIFLAPYVEGFLLERQAQISAEYFLEHTARQTVSSSDDLKDDKAAMEDEAETPYPELLAAMREYNERIYAEKQSGLSDAWAYQASSFDLSEYGIDDEVIGVLTIPAMELEMPIYLGASYANMARGAAQLSQTSLPIGGENTNCVIAGHRGWSGADYFRYIDKLAVGDEVIVTNLWEVLKYTVMEIAVIDPDDIDAILIQPGRDMLTLITCHPYASGGLYRYVVYCERDDSVIADR